MSQVGALARRNGGLADFYLASSRLRTACDMPPVVPGLVVFDQGEIVGGYRRGWYGKFEVNEALILSLIGPRTPELAFFFE